MTLAAKKLTLPFSHIGAPARERRAPSLTLIEGTGGEKSAAAHDTLAGHIGTAVITTYSLFFVANVIVSLLI